MRRWHVVLFWVALTVYALSMFGIGAVIGVVLKDEPATGPVPVPVLEVPFGLEP
nr:hypothetical protein [Micromonospora sp. DSM 115978]